MHLSCNTLVLQPKITPKQDAMTAAPHVCYFLFPSSNSSGEKLFNGEYSYKDIVLKLDKSFA